jgi:hypothetical protein
VRVEGKEEERMGKEKEKGGGESDLNRQTDTLPATSIQLLSSSTHPSPRTKRI